MSSSLTTPLLWNFISSSASFGVIREASLQLEVSILLWFAWELAALPLISHKLFPIISYVHATCMHDHYGTCMATFGYPIFQAHNYMEIDFRQWQEGSICQEHAHHCYLDEKEVGKSGLLNDFLGRKPLYYKRYPKMELGWCYLKVTLWPLVILHYLNITVLNGPLKQGILIMRSLMKKMKERKWRFGRGLSCTQIYSFVIHSFRWKFEDCWKIFDGCNCKILNRQLDSTFKDKIVVGLVVENGCTQVSETTQLKFRT